MYPPRKRFPWGWVILAVLLAAFLVWVSWKPGQTALQFLSSLAVNTLTLGGLIVIPILVARWIIRFFKQPPGE